MSPVVVVSTAAAVVVVAVVVLVVASLLLLFLLLSSPHLLPLPPIMATAAIAHNDTPFLPHRSTIGRLHTVNQVSIKKW